MNTFLKLITPLLLLQLFGGCAVNPATGKQDIVLMSEDQEITLGRQAHAEIIEEYGIYDDDKLANYVQKIGERVAKNSHREDLIYRFTVLDSPQVNAFALPGGYIYVTRGILAHLNSEAELAAVLGHEIGHVTARHSVRRHSAATITGIAGAVLAAASGVSGAGDLANLLGTALVRGYGREHELEADRLGAEYINQTGYDAQAMLDVIRLLKNQETFEKELAKAEDREPRAYHGLFSTHPDNDTRLQRTIKASSKIKSHAKPLSPGRNRYLSMINGLTYGDSSNEGVLRGNRFYHNELDFTLTFPNDWQVKNRPDRLIARQPDGEALMILQLQDLNRRISPKQFLETRLGLEQLRKGAPFNHEGLRGYTAISKANTDYGERDTRFIVIYKDNRAFVIAGASKNAQIPYAFDNTILNVGRSFRPLSARERKLAASRKIGIRKFSSTSYARLAKQSKLNHLAESQIRLLNGHYPRGKPEPGSLIKVIE